VLVHGTTVNHSDWLPTLPRLRQQFTIYALDRRGMGASGDAPDYALEREFEDVAAVVDSVGQPAFLMGHSFGGLCSLEAALLTDNISKLVLYEPPIRTGDDFRPPDIVERVQAHLDAGRPDEVLATFLEEIAGQDPRRVALQRRTRAWPDRVATAHAVVREVRTTHWYDLRPERFAHLGMPALLLQGGDSPPRHVRVTQLLARSLPNARVVELPGQTHIAMHTATQLFVDEIVHFLA
jgi:pimeloyl-ACP methyl ester carboxylesterase